jgi:hypothetical protein
MGGEKAGRETVSSGENRSQSSPNVPPYTSLISFFNFFLLLLLSFFFHSRSTLYKLEFFNLSPVQKSFKISSFITLAVVILQWSVFVFNICTHY